MEYATNCGSHANQPQLRKDGAGMKILMVLAAGFMMYAIGYVGGQDQQLQQPTPTCQIKQ